jgi:hypothetical protein
MLVVLIGNVIAIGAVTLINTGPIRDNIQATGGTDEPLVENMVRGKPLKPKRLS